MDVNIIRYTTWFETEPAWIQDLEEQLITRSLTHYASELLLKAMEDEDELETALRKAIRALLAARQPANQHFRKVFISSGNEIKSDWLVSDLGMRLIIMNADSSNPLTARLQVELLTTENH